MAEFTGSGADALGDLTDWAIAKGAKFNGISFLTDKIEGTGIFACEEIPIGTSLLTIPFSACLSVEAIRGSALETVLVGNEDLLETPDEVMCLMIMHALSHPEVNWGLHVQSFPRQVNNTMNWSDEELQELFPSTVFHLTKLIKQRLVHDWENIHAPLIAQFPSLFEQVTYASYVWALSIVYSRAIGVSRRGEYTRFIPPLLDMANHNPAIAAEAADTFVFSEDDDTISLVATMDLHAGQQCYAVYGEYPNSKLAFNYGFVMYRNPQRRLDLWTRLLPSASHHDEKRRLLEASELTRQQTYNYEGTLVNGSVSLPLLAYIRIIQMNADEIASVEEESRAVTGAMISVRNERASYESLRMLLMARKGNAEDAAADAEALARLLDEAPNPYDRKYMALVIRVEERELIQECIEQVESWLATIDAEGDKFQPLI